GSGPPAGASGRDALRLVRVVLLRPHAPIPAQRGVPRIGRTVYDAGVPVRAGGSPGAPGPSFARRRDRAPEARLDDMDIPFDLDAVGGPGLGLAAMAGVLVVLALIDSTSFG